MKDSRGKFRVYKSKPFARFARKAGIADAEIWNAAQRADAGLIDADLGGGVIKQRIARPGEGKSGGSRSIILFKQGNRAVYVFGFEKKDLGEYYAAHTVRVPCIGCVGAWIYGCGNGTSNRGWDFPKRECAKET
jgi:hypothetical protein